MNKGLEMEKSQSVFKTTENWKWWPKSKSLKTEKPRRKTRRTFWLWPTAKKQMKSENSGQKRKHQKIETLAKM